MRKLSVVLLVASVMVVLCPLAFAGVVRYVSPDATGAAEEDFTLDHPGTLRNAIAASTARSSWEDGDEIVLLPNTGSTKGVYDCSGLTPDETRVAYFFCSKAYLKIRGYSGKREDIELRGTGTEGARCFRVNKQTSFSDLTFKDFVLTLYLTKGSGTQGSLAGGTNIGPTGKITGGGGAICSQGEHWQGVGSVVSNCAFYSCQAGYGGAVQGCTIRDSLFQGCLFSGEYTSVGGAGAAGGACYDCTFDRCGSAADTLKSARGGGTLDCTNSNCLFTACRAFSGAATGTTANFTETGGENVECVFTNCTVVSGGNGVCVCGKATRCLFIDNTGSGLTYGLARSCRIDRCLIVRNRTSNGVMSGNCKDSLFVNNVCTGSGGGKALCLNGVFCNCTIVSNEAEQAIFGGANKASAYNCLIAANKVGGDTVAVGAEGNLYNCTADIDSHPNTPTRDFEKDVNLKNAIRWGADPVWGLPNMPVGIKGRASIKGRGSNLMNDGTTPIWTVDDVDYAGKPRLRDGTIVDIGCYAYDPKGLILIMR